jgi:3-oxoacyl-[acyl-carrier protein] reductase
VTAEPASCAVVTGAGRGIGRALSVALARRSLRRIALLSRTRAELDETALQVEAAGGEPMVIPCDVADPSAVAAAASRILAAFGPPDLVVNSAGIVRRGLTHELSVADWDAVMGANLKGTFLVTRAFLAAMLARGRGRIVNVGSVSSTVGTPRQSAYNAAKWGVVGFTKSLAEELRGTGLQALTVLPGAVDTSMLVGSGFDPQMTPETVAAALVYAGLDAPDAMNGSAIEIFGP